MGVCFWPGNFHTGASCIWCGSWRMCDAMTWLRLIIMVLALYPCIGSVYALGWYILAKVLEHYDKWIFNLLDGMVRRLYPEASGSSYECLRHAELCKETWVDFVAISYIPVSFRRRPESLYLRSIALKQRPRPSPGWRKSKIYFT